VDPEPEEVAISLETMRTPLPGKTAASSTWLKAKVAECLNVPAREIDVSAPLTRYGMDSLAAVEITTAIAVALGCKVPESLLWDRPSVESLEHYMAAVRDGTGPDAVEPVSLHDRMLADSVLPPDIDPGIALPPEAVRSILLTGATGFLGAHVLRTLLLETSATVYCLVRSGGSDEGAARIRHALSSHEIWDASFGPRIRPVPGNIEEPGLGLSPERLDQLSRDVDAVYHCAASVNWVFSYASLRDINVMGTRHLLELACRHKLKPFHFVSSIGVCYSTAGPREVGEEDDMLPHLSGIHMGYAQSKCVAETLVRAASQRGLPAAIYRPALISGDSKRGISNVDDILSRLIKGCVQMHCAPDLDWILDCCPVDHVADAIVKLSRGGNHAMRVFHLSNPVARHWREGVLWMNLYGYPIRLVPYRQWLAQLAIDSSAPAHPLHPLRSFFLERPESAGGLTLPELYEEGRKSRARCDATRSALVEASLSCPPLNARLLDRYFSSYTGRGYLPALAHKGAPPNGKVVVDCDFFTAILRRFHGDDNVRVHAISAPADAPEHSIISELTSWKYGKTAGLRSFSLLAAKGDGAPPASVNLMVKIKPRDEEVMEVGESVAALCSDELGRSFARFKRRTGLALCHLRELAIYEQRDERFRRHAPVLYGTVRDDGRNAWVIVLERLKEVELLNSADDISGWSRAHIEAAVRGIADVHAIWYGREAELLSQSWLGAAFTAAGMAEMRPLWIALAEHCARYFPAVGDSSLNTLQRRLIDDVGDWWRSLETLPRTLIHNDFNPRNLALRRTGQGLRLCAYDWELATLGVPQHDLAELLCFVLTPGHVREEAPYYLDAHRLALERASGRAIDPDSWCLGFRLSLYDLILNRFPMYAMVHALRRQNFLQRVVGTWWALYNLFPYDLPGNAR
jgi:thioester reductase-like protein